MKCPHFARSLVARVSTKDRTYFHSGKAYNLILSYITALKVKHIERIVN